METTEGNHQLLNSVKDKKRFSIDDLGYYNLSLMIGNGDFQCCITDTRSNQCLLLEDYALQGVSSTEQLIQNLYNLFEGHHLLMARFWKSITLAIKNQQFSIVPASVFQKENLKDYLWLADKLDPENDALYYYKHVHSDAVTVFGAKSAFISWINSIYPNKSLQIVHQSSALIEGVQHYKDHTHDKDMFLFMDYGYFNIVVTHNNKFIYFNRFAFKNAEDIVRYTLAVMQELGLKQEATKVLVWGRLTPETNYFQELYKYIRNISFGSKPTYLHFDYMFDDVYDHQYFDLYSMYVCQ